MTRNTINITINKTTKNILDQLRGKETIDSYLEAALLYFIQTDINPKRHQGGTIERVIRKIEDVQRTIHTLEKNRLLPVQMAILEMQNSKKENPKKSTNDEPTENLVKAAKSILEKIRLEEEIQRLTQQLETEKQRIFADQIKADDRIMLLVNDIKEKLMFLSVDYRFDDTKYLMSKSGINEVFSMLDKFKISTD
jgi:hypothetical protein